MKAESAELTGKVAIVSGGSGAIGCAILDAFAQAGARAISLDLSEPKQQTPMDQLQYPRRKLCRCRG